MKSKLFISYRREDSDASSGRLYDTLLKYYKNDDIFKDIDSIPLGSNFKRVIESKIQECSLVLAVIGKQFTSVTDANGDKRLFNTNDFVRLELLTALEKGKIVIPVLVDKASIPKLEELPKELSELPYLNGISLRHDSWYRDTEKLHYEISRLLKIEKPKQNIQKKKNSEKYSSLPNASIVHKINQQSDSKNYAKKPSSEKAYDIEKQQEDAYWRYVEMRRGLTYKDYLDKYPQGTYSKQAKILINEFNNTYHTSEAIKGISVKVPQEMTEQVIKQNITNNEKQKEETYWRYVQMSRGLTYKDYLNKYPDGIYSKEAKKQIY